MEQLNKRITGYLALEIFYLWLVMLICVGLWAFSGPIADLTRQFSPWKWRETVSTWMIIVPLIAAYFGNLIFAGITLLHLFRKNRPAITIDNFVGAAINLIIAIVFSPLALIVMAELAFNAISKAFD